MKGCLLSFYWYFHPFVCNFPYPKKCLYDIRYGGDNCYFYVGRMMVQFRLKSKFSEYRKVPTSSGLSGKEVAEKMLRGNGIYDVQVILVPGFLSDHYDPTKKTVNLSAEVYEGRNVSAAAVAAHECGHAVQHATAYSMLTLRSKLVPCYTN